MKLRDKIREMARDCDQISGIVVDENAEVEPVYDGFSGQLVGANVRAWVFVDLESDTPLSPKTKRRHIVNNTGR